MSQAQLFKLLQVAYADKATLLSAYMPFLVGGGLFVPRVELKLHTPLALLVELPTDGGALRPASGKVVWVNPRQRGVGVALVSDEFGRELKVAIENVLGGSMNSVGQTLTM